MQHSPAPLKVAIRIAQPPDLDQNFSLLQSVVITSSPVVPEVPCLNPAIGA